MAEGTLNPDVVRALREIARYESNFDFQAIYSGDPENPRRFEKYDTHPWEPYRRTGIDQAGLEEKRRAQFDVLDTDERGNPIYGTASGAWQITYDTWQDFKHVIDPNEPEFSPKNQFRVATAILEDTGALNEDGTLKPNWRQLASKRWEAMTKRADILDPDPTAGSDPMPEGLTGPAAGPKGTFAPDERILGLADQLSSAFPDLGEAKKLLEEFEKEDFAPTAPLPPAGAGQSLLGSLFRGLGGEQAVQNDRAAIMSAMNRVQQQVLANQKQQGYQQMRRADMAKARAAIEESEAVQQARAQQASLQARIQEHARTEDLEGQLRLEKLLLEHQQKLREGYHGAKNSEGFQQNLAGLQQRAQQLLRRMEPQYIEENGELILAEDQSAGFPFSAMGELQMERELQDLLSEYEFVWGEFSDNPEAMADMERAKQRLLDRFNTAKTEWELSRLRWNGRYNLSTESLSSRLSRGLSSRASGVLEQTSRPLDELVREGAGALFDQLSEAIYGSREDQAREAIRRNLSPVNDPGSDDPISRTLRGIDPQFRTGRRATDMAADLEVNSINQPPPPPPPPPLELGEPRPAGSLDLPEPPGLSTAPGRMEGEPDVFLRNRPLRSEQQRRAVLEEAMDELDQESPTAAYRYVRDQLIAQGRLNPRTRKGRDLDDKLAETARKMQREG